MNIYSLDECFDKDKNEIGGKALWVSKVKKLNDRIVPKGICISVELFNNFMNHHPYKKEIDILLDEIKVNAITIRKNLSIIRKIITESKLDNRFLNEICRCLNENKIDLTKGVAVRSSSVNEDKEIHVYAGIYTSTLFITDTINLEKAILKTWASQFSETAYIYGGLNNIFNGIAVLIQEMVVGEYHGVIFTQSPNNPKNMLIEASPIITNVVDGHSPIMRLEITRDEYKYNENNAVIGKENIEKVIEIAHFLEKNFHMFVDIEWALKDGEIYILQCRPIANMKQLDSAFLIFEQDDINQGLNLYLGPCQNFFNRFLGKQQLFRKKVLECGFHTYKQFYIIYKKGTLNKVNINIIRKKFENIKFIIIEFGDNNPLVLCTIDDIENQLNNYESKYNNDYIYCRIGEIINADLSGYASINEKGEVLLEYVPGRMNGLIHGYSEPTQVILQNENIKYISKPTIEFIETINDQNGSREKKIYGRLSPNLSDNQVSQLELFTHKLTKEFPNARLEWYFFNNLLYGKDISIESKDLDFSSENKDIISSGYAKGKALFLENINLLDEVADRYNLSLYAHTQEENLIYEDSEFKNFFEKLQKEENVILFADRPSIGLLAISDWVKGFVFRQGSILSHVGICLREKKRVAIISRDSFKEIKDGDEVIITDRVLKLAQNLNSINDDLLQIINEFISSIDPLRKTKSIGIQGGYARGTYNNNSDIDLVLLFTNREDSQNIFKGRKEFENHLFEVRHICLNNLNVLNWKPKQRYIYANETQVLYDNNFELENIINKAVMTTNEQIEIIVYNIRKMGTHGIVYEGKSGFVWRKFKWEDDVYYWIHRNDILTAHLRLNECNEYLITLCFALNKQFLPSSKWRYHIMQNLQWLPYDFETRMKNILAYNLDENSFQIRVKNYILLLNDCINKSIIDQLLPENFGKFYAKKFQNFSDDTK